MEGLECPNALFHQYLLGSARHGFMGFLSGHCTCTRYFFSYLLNRGSKWSKAKMWRQQTALHQLAGQWDHSMSKEGVSFTEIKTAVFETRQRGKRSQKTTMRSPSLAKKPQTEQQLYRCLVVAFMSHTIYVMGRLDTLLKRPHAH